MYSIGSLVLCDLNNRANIGNSEIWTDSQRAASSMRSPRITAEELG